jgi:hypothetical protein
MAAHPHASAAAQRPADRWSAHRAQAFAVRAIVYLGPIVASIVFVHFAGKAVPAPLSSLWLFLAWWFGLSIAATGVLWSIDRMTRRLLPLAALLQLSLVFPDEAPSRFKVAFKAGDVDRLEARLAAKDAAAHAATPSEAAERLLELVAALNIHDPLTRGHCDRVRAYSVMIGEELGLTQDQLDLLNWAALLHDVGKLDVPTEILSKDGRPTDEEWQTLRKHPLFGEELAEPMRAWLGTWTSAIGYHHEHWDGRGYPRGLAGEEIPLPGRIVAVADVFDVITSARSYKKASAAAEGRAEIARCAGTQFDPEVVRAFLTVSLGRMRLVMGPLSWLAHAPLLGRLPFTPALGTAAGVFSVVATTTLGGLAGPAAPRAVASAPAPAPAHVVHQTPQPHEASARPPRPRQVAPHVTPIAPTPPLSPTSGTPGVTPPPVAPTPPATPTAPPEPPAAPPPAPPDHQPPSFEPGPDVTVDEDVGSVSLPWAHAIAADPSGTRVHFAVDAAGSALFSAAPRVADDGGLTFTPAPDAFGTANASVTATDAQGAQVTHPLRITVSPVNDPPSFADGGDVTAVAGDGPVTIPWAAGVTSGPPNESSQTVAFTVQVDRLDLFAPGGEPIVDDAGLLMFTPALLANGTATVTVTAKDDGGTANGGKDEKTTSFHITVLPRNHAPALGVTGVTALEGDGPQSAQVVTALGPGAANEGGQTVTLSLATDHPELFATAPALSQSGLLTFAPAVDAFGTATATVTAHDDGGTANGGDDTTSATFTISIAPVNDAPSFVGGGNVTALENAPPQVVSWAGAISAGPANEAGQTVSFQVSTDNPSLFAPGGQPFIASDGTLSFTPGVAASGTANVTVSAHDDGGTANGGVDSSVPVTFTITVTAVNQPPSFTSGGDVTSLEDAGPQSLQWATSISPGPNESSQTVTFATSTTNAGLFTAAPAISPAGVLTYTAAPDANGTATVTVTAQDDGGTANGGVDTATTTFQLTVTSVNDVPSFTDAGDQSVPEDAGVQSVQWVTTLSAGPADELAQQVDLSLVSTNPGLFSVQPQISPAGVLTYTPAADANGSATVTVTAHDDGGTASGGVDTFSRSFTVTVTPVNDAPAFAGGGNQTVLEDAGAQTLQWATSISPGPADEASQTVSFSATNDDNALFSVQPAVDSTGALTYTPAPDLNGTATVTVTAQDDGGTANGGVDSFSRTFTITVTAVNDAPTIGAISPQTANEDDGPQVASLTTLAAGPVDESTQTLSIGVSVDHPEYFDVGGQPIVDAAGTLAYTPAVGAYGTATVTLTVSDNGGTANAGSDTTTTTFTITLVPLPPIAGDDAYATSVLNLLTVDAAHGVLANDADVNSLTLTVTPETTSAGLLGGTLTLAADGSFTYQAPLLPGQDQFTYTITNGNGDTATGTITIDVSLGAPTASTFFLQTSGLSAEIWDLGNIAPATVTPVPDLDGDGHPGLTITGGDGKQTITDVKKQQAWTYETGGSTLAFHGPRTQNQTAAAHKLELGKAETLWVYVYDCPGGSSTTSTTGCTLLGQNKVLVAKWNTTATYETHSAVVPVDADLAPNRQLRVRLLIGGADLWIPLVGPYNSSVDYTG